MLFDIFYPEDFKKIAAELRNKNDLNKKALYSLNMRFLFFIVLCPVLISYVPFYKGHYFSMVVCFIFFSVTSYYLYFLPLLNCVVIPYSTGNKVLGTVLFSMKLKNKSVNGWRVEYAFEIVGQKIQGKTEIYFDLNKGFYIPQKHDDAVIYFNPSNPKRSTLFMPDEFKKHCLSKSVFKNTPC